MSSEVETSLIILSFFQLEILDFARDDKTENVAVYEYKYSS